MRRSALERQRPRRPSVDGHVVGLRLGRGERSRRRRRVSDDERDRLPFDAPVEERPIAYGFGEFLTGYRPVALRARLPTPRLSERSGSKSLDGGRYVVVGRPAVSSETNHGRIASIEIQLLRASTDADGAFD